MTKVSVLAIAAVALLGAESATAQLPLPDVPTPPPVPTVTTPTLLDPVLEAVPAVPRPPATPQVPALPLPQTPRVPGVTTVPNVGGVPNVSGVPNRRPASSPGGQATGGNAPARSPSSGGSGSGATTTGGSAGDAPGAGRPAGPAGSGSPASVRRTTVRRVRRERRLRATVRRLQDCFGALSALERRVLVLRAGVGAGPPRTRFRVARRLDLSMRRVTRLERRGVRTLRRLAGAGRCGAAASRPPPALLPGARASRRVCRACGA